MPTVTAFLQGYLIPAVTWIGNNINAVFALGGAIGFTTAMVKTWSFWQGVSTQALLLHRTYLMFGGGAYGIYTTATILAKSATDYFTTSVMTLNAAIRLNPIGFAITALAALAAATIYAYENFSSFRNFCNGSLAAIKEVGRVIYDYMVTPLMSLGKILHGAFTGNFDEIKKGMVDMGRLMSQNIFTIGQRVGDSFNKGFTEGMVMNVSTATTDIYKKQFGVVDSPLSKYAFKGFGASTSLPSAANATPQNLGIGKKGKEISGENRQVKNITITIGSLISGGFTVVNNNLKESEQAIRDVITRTLVDATNQVNYQ
jgi:hypothetical protein